MKKIYYLFSETDARRIGGVEAVYVCNDWGNNKSPILQTGVYPMGTLLSKAINFMKPWWESNFEPHLRDEKLSEGFEKVSEQKSSFSNAVCDDSAVRNVFELLLEKHSGAFLLMTDKHIAELLQDYMKFIESNQKTKEHSSIENLTAFANKKSNELPKSSIESDFVPLTKKRESLWKSLTSPVSIFQIHDIVDFILASLQCVFKQDYVIGKCKYYACGDLFVTHNKSLRYCPIQDPEIKSCQEKSKVNNQIERERASESIKRHKSISAMLNQRIGALDMVKLVENRDKEHKIRTNDYENFLKQTKILRKDGTMNDKEYMAWMDKYWENVKANTKIRLKEYKK